MLVYQGLFYDYFSFMLQVDYKDQELSILPCLHPCMGSNMSTMPTIYMLDSKGEMQNNKCVVSIKRWTLKEGH
jgi:hypothetical protein